MLLAATLLCACPTDEPPEGSDSAGSTGGPMDPSAGTPSTGADGADPGDSTSGSTSSSMSSSTSFGDPDASSGTDDPSVGSSSSTGSGVEGPFCILPLGDSITQADSTHVGYRYWLWEMLTQAGWDVDFIGSHDGSYGGGVPPYPDPDFDRDHEGHWGWTADQLLAPLPGWLGGYTPSLVVLHIGTNDDFLGQPLAGTLDEIAQIIEVLRSDNPEVVVILAQVIPSVFATHDPLNASLPSLGEELSTPTSPVIVVAPPPGFDANTDLFDGVHPNESGEQKMAQNFFAAIEAALGDGLVGPC